jgi:hypothetical protein
MLPLVSRQKTTSTRGVFFGAARFSAAVATEAAAPRGRAWERAVKFDFLAQRSVKRVVFD